MKNNTIMGLRHEFEKEFKDFINKIPDISFPSLSVEKFPRTDIVEGDNELILMLAIPGVLKDEVDINIEKNILTVKIATSNDYQGELIQREIQILNCKRVFDLSKWPVDQNKIKAVIADGILTIKISYADCSYSKIKNIPIS